MTEARGQGAHAQGQGEEGGPVHDVAAERCPRCGAILAGGQQWCVGCGLAARTRIARSPSWRIPIVLGALVVALCGAALAFGFARLANTDTDLANARARSSPVTVTTTTAAPPPTTTTTAPTTSTAATTTTTTAAAPNPSARPSRTTTTPSTATTPTAASPGVHRGVGSTGPHPTQPPAAGTTPGHKG